MFDPFTLALIGGAAGGLMNKKDPLKGALLGAGAGYTGGALAGGGLLGAAPAAATPAAGYTGGALAGGGLLGAAPAAATPAAGASSMATSLPAFNPITGTYANATQLPGVTGAMETLKSFNSAVKPVGEAMGTAMQAQGMFQDNTPMPVAQSSLPPRSQMDVSGLLGNGQVAQLQQKRMARRGLMG